MRPSAPGKRPVNRAVAAMAMAILYLAVILPPVARAHDKVAVVPVFFDEDNCPEVPPDCPAEYAERTPGDVHTDLQAAISAQNWGAVACNYAEDAFVIDDQGILVGHADIILAAQSLSTLFNGVSPSVIQKDEFRDTVRLLDSLNAGWVEIPDRTRTFVVECGIITRQTSHGLLKFNGPPPDQQ